MLDNCDCAGIIEPDLDLARFQLGANEELVSPSQAFGDRVQVRDGKVLILKFIKYQYGDSLNNTNNAHKGVIKRLESSSFNDFLDSQTIVLVDNKLAPNKPLPRGYLAHQDKDKEKDKDKVSNIKKKKKSENDAVKENTPLMIRIGSWFRRRPDILWTVKEKAALDAIPPAFITESQVDGMEYYYTTTNQDARKYLRRDLITLLNNWMQELDRARNFES
jgi:hypothetical protein